MFHHFRFQLLLTVLFAAVAASAQVGMDLKLNRTMYMQYEPVFACVTLRNDSGRALPFGQDPRLQGFVLFEITDSSGKLVPKRPGAELTVTGLVLMPGQEKTMILPVNRYYQIDKTGVYRIHAYVSHSLLPNEYKSADLKFNVEPGIQVWKRSVGLPDLTGENQDKVAKERTYSIRTITENASKYFYLVIEDADKVYAIARIGKAIGREPFLADVDMLSRLHILMPVSPKVFHYLAFSPDGRSFADSYRKTAGTIPVLSRDPATGLIRLLGGEEARVGVDYTDPDTGKVRAADLLAGNDQPASDQKSEAPSDKGMVDLGKSL